MKITNLCAHSVELVASPQHPGRNAGAMSISGFFEISTSHCGTIAWIIVSCRAPRNFLPTRTAARVSPLFLAIIFSNSYLNYHQLVATPCCSSHLFPIPFTPIGESRSHCLLPLTYCRGDETCTRSRNCKSKATASNQKRRWHRQGSRKTWGAHHRLEA